MYQHRSVHGAGLGLRREHLSDLSAAIPDAIDFFELAPENWMEMGGPRSAFLSALAEQVPIAAHGLSLSLGGAAPLDERFLGRIKQFLDRYEVELFTEHLSWCGDSGHLYDLLPLPLTGEAVRHVAGRIRRTQEILERRIAVENPSFYLMPPGAEMTESEFIRAVLEEADCDLHLDVNNIYVNSRNFGFDPAAFLTSLPLQHVVYIHVAGHYTEHDGVIVDTHGATVIDPVWQLLELAYRHTGPVATTLERDFNIPPLAKLLDEVEIIRRLQSNRASGRADYADVA